MFASIVLSLASFLLAGMCCCVVFTSSALKRHRLRQQAVVGVVFGVLASLLDLADMTAPFDVTAGPFLFAGYLGGPVGAVLATLFGFVGRLGMAEPFVTANSFVSVGSVATGVLIGYLMPPRDWPRVSGVAVTALTSASLGLNLLLPLGLGHFGPTDPGREIEFAWTAAAPIAGVLSILLTWIAARYANGAAQNTLRSIQVSKRLNLFPQTTELGMFEYELTSDGILCDRGLAIMYGLGDQAVTVSKSEWLARIHPDDQKLAQNTMDALQRGDKQQDQIDLRTTRRDGKETYVRINWAIEPDKNDTPSRVIGLHCDLTDIRKSEQDHLESKRALALMIDSLPGAVMQRHQGDDGLTTLRYISPNCKSIWGYTDQEIYANPDLIALAQDPEDVLVFKGKVNMAGLAGTTVTHRFRITTRDGERKWLDFHGASVSSDGSWGRFEGLFLDVTNEVEAQERAERNRELAYRAQKNESIGHLTGGVAHDFNNLLAVVLGSLELLQDEDDPSAQKDLIDQAITATLRGADLTKSMLAFARQAQLEPEVLAANDVVREAKNWIVRTLPESVSVEISLFDGLWRIKTDRSSLESALLNLILNARDAMESHGSLIIETANVTIEDVFIDARQEELEPGRYVMLAVSDTGPGISKANLASIFEPFFTTKPPGSGTGLGLSMVVGFMRQSGGTVQVYSEVGKGTTFKLYFPASDAPVIDTPKPTTATDYKADGRRILVVEDEDTVRNMIEIILRKAGYQVAKAASGDDALVIFKTDPNFDLLLTDIVMPGTLQGASLSFELRKLQPDLPVVFMSGYANEAIKVGNELRPEDIRLMKPVQRADLLAAVSKAISVGSSQPNEKLPS